MNTQEIFAEQLANTPPYTLEMLQELTQDGRFREGSDQYNYHLAHIGERRVFALVYHEGSCDSPISLPFKAAIEGYFESELDDFIASITDTHEFCGYNTTAPIIPRFLLKERMKNVAAKVYN